MKWIWYLAIVIMASGSPPPTLEANEKFFEAPSALVTQKEVTVKDKEIVDVEILHIGVEKNLLEIITLPPVDYEKIVLEIESAKNDPKKDAPIGTHRRIELVAKGKWRAFSMSEDRCSWRAIIHSPDAEFIRPHFKLFPSDGDVYCYGEAGPDTVEGPIRKPAVYEGGEFWGPMIEGEYLFLEVITGCNSQEPELIIDTISHGYLHPLTGTTNDPVLKQRLTKESWCYIDASCDLRWRLAKTGVARITYEKNLSTYESTGVLLNDHGPTAKNWFLTANHSINGNSVAHTLIAYFLYSTDYCNGSIPSLPTIPRTTGATFVVGRGEAGSDFSLLDLDGNVPSGVLRLGWTTAALPVGAEVVCIHHPGGSYKKISYGTEDYSFSSAYDLTKYWSVLWTEGSTEAGSSGAPLFNASTMQIVGQLSGGYASCGNMLGHDYFGKFSTAWADGLSDYLVGGGAVSPQITAIISNLTTNPHLGETFRLSVPSIAPDGVPLNYRFYYKAGYGTPAFHTNRWQMIQDWSPANRVDVTFSAPGNYYLVGHVTPEGKPWGAGDPQGGFNVTLDVDTQITDVTAGVIGNAQVGEIFGLIMHAVDPQGALLNYRFYYKADYGTPAFHTNRWQMIQDWSPANGVDVTFSAPGNYYLVGHAVPEGETWVAGDPQGGFNVVVRK